MTKQYQAIGEALYHHLTTLHEAGRIPLCKRGIIKQSRWQREPQYSGVHYGRPQHVHNMGRYNDVSGRTGVCYTADYSVTAIAESYGRQYHKTNNDFYIGEDELHRATLCTLATTRPTITIDMGRLAGLLHCTSDQLAGNNQTITRQIVDWAANQTGDYDGVTYLSRHLAVGTCTAWWWHEGTENPLITLNMASLNDFKDSDVECFPENWGYLDIEGVEIITETLGFKITPNTPD